VHQKNTDLVKLGIFNKWVEKSFTRLARLVPARYAKFEESSGYVETFNRLVAYDRLTERHEPVVAAVTPSQAKAQAEPQAQTQAQGQTQTQAQGLPQPEDDKAAKDVPDAAAPAGPQPAPAPSKGGVQK
jgi:hypothetical protein